MGENEMKPKYGLPCGVRLTEGLGGAGGVAPLALAAEVVVEPERRDTLSIGDVLTSGSVPELNPIGHRLGVPEVVWVWCFLAGELPAEGRAATTRPWFLHLPAMALPKGWRFYAAWTFRCDPRG